MRSEGLIYFNGTDSTAEKGNEKCVKWQRLITVNNLFIQDHNSLIVINCQNLNTVLLQR